MAIGIIGIVAALLIFLIMIYRGVSLFIAAPISVIIVAVTNNLNPLTSFTDTYVGGLTQLISPMFSIIFFGVILGKIYTDTGCALVIADGLMKRFVLKRTSVTEKDQEHKVRMAILVVFIFESVCNFGGIDGYVLMFTAVPILIVIAKEVDIPRRFIPGMMFLSVPIMAAPGAPQISNIIAVAIFNGAGYHVTAASGLVTGIIGCIIIAFGAYTTLSYLIIRAKRNGETFDYGNLKAVELNTNRKLPNFYLAFLPLILVFILYTILRMHISIALLSGILLTLLIGAPFIEHSDVPLLTAIKNSLSFGSYGYPNALLNIITPAGLAAVITATAAFGNIVGTISSLKISIYLITFLAVALVVALTASPPAALQVSIPIVIGIVAGQGLHLDMGNILRIAVFTSITFESLPWNGMIVTLNQLVDTNHKRSYFPVFLQTVVYTTLAALAAVVICIVVPNLP